VKEDDCFKFFTASQIFRSYDLTYDQIKDGLCGSSLDGGVDSIFIFFNNDYICEDYTIDDKFKIKVDNELIIIQSKNERSFGEGVFLRLTKISSNLLDLEFNPMTLKKDSIRMF